MNHLTLPARISRRVLRSAASRRARKGATALEYAIVLAFVAVSVLAALSFLGTGLNTAMTNVGAKIGAATK